MRLIDADRAYEVLTDYYHHRTDFQHQSLIEALNRVPTIYPPMGYKVLADGRGWAYYSKEEVEPVRRGKWVGIDDYPYETWECDQCGYIHEEIGGWVSSYCPNCGAKMEVE